MTRERKRPREYMIWSTIKSRCTNPKANAYNRYGGAGIRMCDKWLNSFEDFISYVGRPPTEKHTIDRIDPSKGYEPGNVRWATYTEQNRHRSNTIVVLYKGEQVPLGELCEAAKIDYKAVYTRIFQYHWPIERALSQPVKKRN